jgi:hypothetical protein
LGSGRAVAAVELGHDATGDVPARGVCGVQGFSQFVHGTGLSDLVRIVNAMADTNQKVDQFFERYASALLARCEADRRDVLVLPWPAA